MKKRIHVYFSFIIFLSFFLCLEVSASTTCVYKWNNESILLTKEDSSDFFDKIEANINISIADGNMIWANQNGTCPSLSFYHGSEWFGSEGIVINRIFASQELCRNGGVVTPSKCSEELSGEKLSDSQSIENVLGKSQANLIKKGENYCHYKSTDNEFYVSNGSTSFHPNYSCQYKDEGFRCQLDSNGDKAYFHGIGTSGSFICPQYIYYQCKYVSMPSRQICTIIGSGGSGDTNISGIESSVKGDESGSGDNSGDGSGGDTTINTSPLDCDGIFSGAFGDFLKEVWKLIKFVVPILVIGLAIVDFLKAMSSHDEAEVKKASSKLVKRLVIGVLIFVLPIVIELLLQWAGIEYGTCNIR